eukprot:scaffold9933_cov226-Amphora_coffeaeformis.AAC.1
MKVAGEEEGYWYNSSTRVVVESELRDTSPAYPGPATVSLITVSTPTTQRIHFINKTEANPPTLLDNNLTHGPARESVTLLNSSIRSSS